MDQECLSLAGCDDGDKSRCADANTKRVSTMVVDFIHNHILLDTHYYRNVAPTSVGIEKAEKLGFEITGTANS